MITLAEAKAIYFDGSRRAYTVRRFSPDFLHVETVGEFQEHATKWGAREAAKEVV